MFYLTQTLLSSWQHFLDSDDAYAEDALASFIQTLKREPKETTTAMQAGIDFESAINAVVAGDPVDIKNEKEARAIRRFSRLCAGGQPQVPVTGDIAAAGLEIRLYGVCDYVKAGTIYDIKRVQRYEYGKYFHSPQHPMYLHLVPGAAKFSYLIFNGTDTFIETYRRGDFVPIKETIAKFINWLQENGYMSLYEEHWNMNAERMEKTHGI